MTGCILITVAVAAPSVKTLLTEFCPKSDRKDTKLVSDTEEYEDLEGTIEETCKCQHYIKKLDDITGVEKDESHTKGQLDPK